MTLLFHDQRDDVLSHIKKYRQVLVECGLLDIAFHMSPLTRGHKDYEGMAIQERKRLFQKFTVFSQHLPFEYVTFAYRKSDFDKLVKLLARIKRDVTLALLDNLEYLQDFDEVKVYYDDSQQEASKILRDAISYTLSKNAYLFRDSSDVRYILSQVADYVCGLELAAIKYESGENANTENIFFGGKQSFKKNHLKKIRKHQLAH